MYVYAESEIYNRERKLWNSPGDRPIMNKSEVGLKQKGK
jgi:hypothetical protein